MSGSVNESPNSTHSLFSSKARTVLLVSNAPPMIERCDNTAQLRLMPCLWNRQSLRQQNGPLPNVHASLFLLVALSSRLAQNDPFAKCRRQTVHARRIRPNDFRRLFTFVHICIWRVVCGRHDDTNDAPILGASDDFMTWFGNDVISCSN